MDTKLKFQLTLEQKYNPLPFSEVNSATNDTMKVLEALEMVSRSYCAL